MICKLSWETKWFVEWYIVVKIFIEYIIKLKNCEYVNMHKEICIFWDSLFPADVYMARNYYSTLLICVSESLSDSVQALEYLLWASISLELSVPLMTAEYLPWIITLYCAVCYCYFDSQAAQQAEVKDMVSVCTQSLWCQQTFHTLRVIPAVICLWPPVKCFPLATLTAACYQKSV